MCFDFSSCLSLHRFSTIFRGHKKATLFQILVEIRRQFRVGSYFRLQLGSNLRFFVSKVFVSDKLFPVFCHCLCFFVSNLFVFGSNFTIEITFDVAISTSEAMQFQAESLVIVKTRIYGFNIKLKPFFFEDYTKIYLFDGMF